MPHFWMSYFQVDDVSQTVAIAKQSGAIIEVKPTDFYDGKIALIRDPQGAGFTVYDGENLNFAAGPKKGTVAYNELHVSNANNVLEFYEKIFNWQFEKANGDKTYHAYDATQNWITSIKELPNTVKGKYEYWVITFDVEDVAAAVKQVEKWGGAVVAQDGKRVMVTDNSREAFFYLVTL